MALMLNPAVKFSSATAAKFNFLAQVLKVIRYLQAKFVKLCNTVFVKSSCDERSRVILFFAILQNGYGEVSKFWHL